MMPEDERNPESNPFVEVAAHLFLEDLAERVGVPGLNTYLVSLASRLARSMPDEEYRDWPDFLGALVARRSILSAFEEVRPMTDRCMVTPRSPFERGWREYAKRVGAFAPVHREVATYYNAHVRPAAVMSLHIVSHTYREAAAAKIRVQDRPVRYEPIATVWVDGQASSLPEAALEPLLRRAGITRTQLGMLLRDHADIWLLEPA